MDVSRAYKERLADIIREIIGDLSYAAASAKINSKIRLVLGSKHQISTQLLHRWHTKDYTREISEASALRLGVYLGLPRTSAAEDLQAYLKGYKSLKGDRISREESHPPETPLTLSNPSAYTLLAWQRWLLNSLLFVTEQLEGISRRPRIQAFLEHHLSQIGTKKLIVHEQYRDRFNAIRNGQVPTDDIEDWEYGELANILNKNLGYEWGEQEFIEGLARFSIFAPQQPPVQPPSLS